MKMPQVTVIYDKPLQNKSNGKDSSDDKVPFQVSDKRGNEMRLRLLVAPCNSQSDEMVEIRLVPKIPLKPRASLKLSSKGDGNQLRGCTSSKQTERSVIHRCTGKISVADFRRRHPKLAKKLADNDVNKATSKVVPNIDVFDSPLVMVSVPVKKVKFNSTSDDDMNDDGEPASSNDTDSLPSQLLPEAKEIEFEKGSSCDGNESAHELKLLSTVEADNSPLQLPASDSIEKSKEVIEILSSDDEMEETHRSESFDNSKQSVSLLCSANATKVMPTEPKTTEPKKTPTKRIWYCDVCCKPYKNKNLHLKTMRHKLNAM